MKRIYWLAPLILITCMIVMVPVYACTLWAATGDHVLNGGSLIAKNRDWAPNHQQELRLIKPAKGFAYLGIFAVDGDAPGIKAGINDHSLVVISASASTIPRKERLSLPHTKNLMTKLLNQCKNVDEVLSKRSWFVGPEYLMVADRSQIAYVEIAPDGQLGIKIVSNGTLSHTNHYLEKDLLQANQKIGDSSKTRLDRINTLLSQTATPFTLDQFVAFSTDQMAGPDNSIWRNGSTPHSERTLSTWIISLPTHGDPVLYLKLANPNHPITVQKLNVATVFKEQQFLHTASPEKEGVQ